MAEQHYKETVAAKKALEVGEHDSGYRFDLALCRRTFDEYDKDMSGYLDIRELTSLAEVMYLNDSVLLSFPVKVKKLKNNSYFRLDPMVCCISLLNDWDLSGRFYGTRSTRRARS